MRLTPCYAIYLCMPFLSYASFIAANAGQTRLFLQSPTRTASPVVVCLFSCLPGFIYFIINSLGVVCCTFYMPSVLRTLCCIPVCTLDDLSLWLLSIVLASGFLTYFSVVDISQSSLLCYAVPPLSFFGLSLTHSSIFPFLGLGRCLKFDFFNFLAV